MTKETKDKLKKHGINLAVGILIIFIAKIFMSAGMVNSKAVEEVKNNKVDKSAFEQFEIRMVDKIDDVKDDIRDIKDNGVTQYNAIIERIDNIKK